MADEVIRAWLVKVEDDLKTIRNCLRGPEPITTSAAYHCQQAAEKLVKAILVHSRIQPPRTHDIETLLGLLDPAHPLADRLEPFAAFTPYAWTFRYPAANPIDAGMVEPSLAEIESWHDEIARVRLAFERIAFPTDGANP